MKNFSEADKIKINLYRHIFKKNKDDIIGVPEVTVEKNVADMLVINGEIEIYEIKSKNDSLKRLKDQIETFRRHADKVIVVADQKFIDKLESFEYMQGVGLIKIDNRGKFIPIREASRNKIEKKDYFSYWAPVELRESLRGFPKWYEYSTLEAKEKLLEILSPDEIRRYTIYRLKEKYRMESYKRRWALKDRDYKTTLQSRFENLEPLNVEPLLMLPIHVFRDFC